MADLPARSSRLAFAAFDAVFDRWMARKIHDIRILRSPEAPPRGPLLLCANHTSWWDGFFLRRLARQLRPGAPLFTVMLEREIRVRPWLRQLGALGITPGSSASLRALAGHLKTIGAKHPQAVVSFFPQGRIWPSTRRPLGFQRGIELVRRALRPAALFPVAIHVEAGAHPTPAAYLMATTSAANDGHIELETRVHDQLNLIHAFLAKYGEDAHGHSIQDLE